MPPLAVISCQSAPVIHLAVYDRMLRTAASNSVFHNPSGIRRLLSMRAAAMPYSDYHQGDELAG